MIENPIFTITVTVEEEFESTYGEGPEARTTTHTREKEIFKQKTDTLNLQELVLTINRIPSELWP